MAKMMKCLECGKRFDIETEEYVTNKAGNRYLHKECGKIYFARKEEEKTIAQQKSQEEAHRQALIQYVMELTKTSRPGGLLLKQIKEYREMGYTYQGMLSTMKYFHETLEKPVVGEGIGIVPYVYNDAIEFWKNKINNEESYQKLVKKGVKPVQKSKDKIIVKPKKNKKKQKKINIEELM